MHVKVNRQTLELVQGDITLQEADAVVNAANSRLAGGGGVDGAIHRRGGPAIMEETDAKYPDGCPTGSAVISGAGRLKARYVIHAVGPVWQGGAAGEAALLAGCYTRALALAAAAGAADIAFPAISTGIFGYPPEAAARVAVAAVSDALAGQMRPVRVTFCCFDEAMAEIYRRVLQS